MRRTRLVVWVVVLAAAWGSAAESPLVELARSGRWRRVLEVARLRGRQLPLERGEALIAAEAARRMGAPRSEREAYLRSAVGGDGPGQVAAVELARARLGAAPDDTLALALAVLEHPATWRLREAAVAAAAAAVERGGRIRDRRRFRRILGRQPRSLRRKLELAMAISAANPRPLRTLVERNPRDLVAYRAARELERLGAGSARDAWLVGQALYWHGLYEEAGRLLAKADAAGAASPRWKAAYLLGRCAFRRERWSEAEGWYRKAVGRARGGTTRAEMAVHLARTLELAGETRKALEWARRAVRFRRSDERLLLQARLALAQGRSREARKAVRRCRRRSSRDRGEILFALDSLRRGAAEEALSHLARVKAGAWQGPASVTAAWIQAERGRRKEALSLLDTASARSLAPFWELSARRLMGELPPELVARWRAHRGPAGSVSLEDLAAWTTLEPDATLLEALRRHLRATMGSAPVRPRGLAGELWRLGLQGLAARWDPRGFPRATLEQAAAAVRVLSRHGEPAEAMVAADALRRKIDGGAPVAMLPREAARALYPLPESTLCRAEARRAGVPWWLLAAVVREESRWNPDALSAVGARGLVQLMPETAARLAGELGEPAPAAEDLFDPELALHLGAQELARLMERFGDRPAVVAAAYNAGEAQTRLWLQACPAECSEPVFLLTVGFGATRAYAADVAAAAEWYRDLYGAAAGSGSAVQGR